MGLASALTTALTGMQAAETQVDVVGNNLANSQTVAFKASTAVFATQFLQTQSLGSSPTATDGGTNPRQTGLGTRVAAIAPDFTQGTIEISSTPSDLAIQGDGFFIVQNSNGETQYTRNGQFKTNANNDLVTLGGDRVLGYGVDEDFAIQQTGTAPLEIPLGMRWSRPTDNVFLQGVLTPAGDVSDTAGVVQTATLAASGGGPLTAGTLLTDVVDTSQGPTPLFSQGVLEFTGRKGGRALTPQTLDVTATTTVQDLMDFMQEAAGIQTAGDDPLMPDSVNNIPSESGTLSSGIVIQNGQIRIVSNNGTGNEIEINPSAFRLTTTGGVLQTPSLWLCHATGRCWRKRGG